MERIRLHNLAASGTMYGTAIAASERMRINMQIYMGGALKNELVKYILDKLYIYSAPNYKDVSEFGKPIYDKWTIHRIFMEFKGILIYAMNNERTLYTSFILLFLYYTGLLIITQALDSDEYHSASIHREIEIIKLQMEMINIKRLQLKLKIINAEN